MGIAFEGLGDIPPKDARLSRRAKRAPAPGLALPSKSRGTVPARPCDGFLRDIPFALLGDPPARFW
jgi:hypothetical protein